MATPLNLWSALPGANQREFPENDPAKVEIFGYCDQLSYVPGETVRVRVHTTAKFFDLAVILDSASGEVVYRKVGIPGTVQVTPANAYETGCQWSDAVSIPIESGWPSGVYIITLTAADPTGAAIEREAVFVVRPTGRDTAGRILMILTTGTYVAYNDWGGANAYRSVVDNEATDVPAPRLSLLRPWARGFLRLPAGAPRHADAPDLPPHAAPRLLYAEWALENGYSRHYADAGWAYYERPFAAWARQNGYAIDFITQHDLHDKGDILKRYGTAIIVGHDEYWTWEMRDAVDSFVTQGGRLARFAGNFLWQTRLEDGGTVQVCHKIAVTDPVHSTERRERTTTHWDAPVTGRPAAATMGLTGVGGIYVRFGAVSPRSSGGFTVYRPDHWALRGTDLRYGDELGTAPSRILSFEVDGVDYTFRDGLPYPTHIDGAPQGLEIIAMAPAARGERPCKGALLNAPLEMLSEMLKHNPAFYEVRSVERGAAMMATFSSGKGSVFNSGCCNWVSGLIHHDFFVEQITRNVLDASLRESGGAR